MATSREERMASRLRGAGRRIEEDISFGFVLPEIESSTNGAAPAGPGASVDPLVPAAPPPGSSPPQAAPRSANPTTSAKRRRIASREPVRQAIPTRSPVAPLAPPPLPLPAQRSSRSRPDPYDALNNSPQSTRSRTSLRSRHSGPATGALWRSIVAQTPGQVDEDDMESLPGPTPRTGQRRIAIATTEEEVVQESPAEAPGSGQRRRVVRVNEVAGGAGAVLQQVMRGTAETRQRTTATRDERLQAAREEDEEDEITAEMEVDLGVESSPLVSKSTQREKEKEKTTPKEIEQEDEITAEMHLSVDLRVGSSPLARKVAQRKKNIQTAEEKEGRKGTQKIGTGRAEQEGEKSVLRRTARRSGVGATGFGMEEVDELSPAQPPAASSSASRKRTVRLSGASADDDVDELSPAVTRTAKRSVTRPARVMADTTGADELSPVHARTAGQRGRPQLKKAVGDVEAPSPVSVKATRRRVGPSSKSAPETAKTPSQVSTPAKGSVGRLRKGRSDEVPVPSSVPSGRTERAPQHPVDAEADELEEPSPAPPRNARRSVRVSDVSAGLDEVDELSPERTREFMGPPPRPGPQTKLLPARAAQKVRPGTKTAVRRQKRVPAHSTSPTQTPQRSIAGSGKVISTEEPGEPEEPEEAEEIDVAEAARRLGRKRPRRSIPAPAEADDREQQPDQDEPPTKRRRGRPPQSPAAQQPPKTRKDKRAASASSAVQLFKKPPAKRKARPSTPAGDEDELQGAANTVPIIVQRFTKKTAYRSHDADGEPDVLQADPIPFASRSGVNAVDVLAQVCAELAGSYLSTLRDQARNPAADAAARREAKAMARALELFGEGLRTRLLEHAVALDALHALRKRVRRAQRERVALREEIVRIRREREGVEVRKDAVRVRHERERERAMANISLSSAMHDVDLAVENGLAAGPLNAKEESRANLANLEFLISSVSEQACSKSGQGGTLKQIREFNAFLERAAAVLEGR